MNDFDETLRCAQEQLARKKRVYAMLDSLRGQEGTLCAREKELAHARAAEEKDALRLEGRSLAAFFYGVIGKKDEKLDKERKEAYAAAVRHDAVVRELEDVRQQMHLLEEESAVLGNCEQQYKDALASKEAHLRQVSPAYTERILALESGIAACEKQLRELDEASAAGRAALDASESVLSSLGSAENWGTWDMLGGGFFSDIMKHDHLDEAQGGVERLQVALRRFQTELSDVTIEADMQVRIDGFLRFADYFFDGLFADWAVMDRIQTSKQRVKGTKGQIEDALGRLRAMHDAAEQERARLGAEREALILRA